MALSALTAHIRLKQVVTATASAALVATLGVLAAAPAHAATGAVLDLDGCGDYVIARNDDGSSGLVELPFLVNFYGRGYDQLYVNNNGNVTFESPLGTFTPFGLVATNTPIIAPFFADVDTRGGAGQVTFGPTTYEGHDAFCVTWPGVGYYPNQVDKLNTFQLLLVEKNATTHDFDIVFNYDSVQWETGSASGGAGGFGGSPARAGFSSGEGTEATSYELPGSGVAGALLDTDLVSGLAHGSRGSSVPGRYTFAIRHGSPNYILRSAEELYGADVMSLQFADPVDSASGNLVDSVTDLQSVGGRADLGAGRTYNSRDARVSSFGRGWSSLVDVAVTPAGDGSVGLRDVDGRLVPFVSTGTGWNQPQGFAGRLSGTDDGYAVTFPDGGAWSFDATGRLALVSGSDGTTLTLTRDGDGDVVALSDSTGPSVTLVRDGAGRVVREQASDGREVAFAYDGDALARVTDVGGGVTVYAYDERGYLRTRTDPDGQVAFTNTFDSLGRVTSQSTVGEAVRFEYDDIAGTTTVHDDRTGEQTVVHHDEQGHPTVVVDPAGATVTRTFDGAGNLASVTDRTNGTESATYDDHGNLLTATDALGQREAWEYDSADRVVASTDAAGGRTTYTYDGDEREPATVTAPDGGVTRQHVVDGLVLSVTDPDGVSESFAYDTVGNLVEQRDGLGAVTRYTRDGAGRVESMTTPEGRTTTYGYDAYGRVTSTTTAAGTESVTFDPVGRVLTSTSATGGVTRYAYDPAGRLVATTDAVGGVTRTEYDTAGRISATVSAQGGRTVYAYGALGRIDSVTDPTGGVTAYTYDSDGNVASVTDPLGRTTRQELDALGRQVVLVDAAGTRSRFTYDALGDVVKVAADGVGTTTARYDALGRVLSVTTPDGSTASTAWTRGGRVARSTDGAGIQVSYGYDAAGQLVTATDALGGVTRTAYDTDGLVLRETSPAGRTVTYAYDAAARLVRTTSPDGGVARRELDAAGNLLAAVTPSGARTTYRYDAAGQLTSATDPLGATTSYQRSGALVTAVVDPAGAVQRRGFDLAGRQTSSVDRAGATTTYTYDAAGQLVGVQDPSGRTEARSYDAVGNLVRTVYGDGSAETFTYDRAGHRLTATNGAGTTTSAYDGAGRLVRQVDPQGRVQTWAYDGAGRQTSSTDPNGAVLSRTFDAAGRLVAASQTGWGTVTWTLDADGLVTAEKLPGGQSRTWAYDRDGQVGTYEQKVAATTSKVTLTHDLDGHLTGTRTTGGLGAGSAAYAYDAAGQLVRATTADLDPLTPAVQTWAYDATGARTSASRDGLVTTSTYDAAHRLATTVTGGATTRYTYDAAGRRISETSPLVSTGYTYDAAGRLVTRSAKALGITATERRGYDADGRLASYAVQRGLQSVSTSTTWDPTAAVPRLTATTTASTLGAGRLALTTTTSTSWVDAGTGVLGLTRSGGSSAVLAKDALGSVTTTVPTLDVATAAAYDPYGVADSSLALSDLSLTPTFGYRGSLTLGDDLYLDARTYDPATGQLLTRDPVEGRPGAVAATDDYTYAANQPLDLVDPSGLSPVSDGMFGALGLGGLVSAATPDAVDLSEWSGRHRAVQRWFMAVIKPGTVWEVKIPGGGVKPGTDGRADLVYRGTQHDDVWEVKTATWLYNGKRQRAIDQLVTYVSKLPGGKGRRGATYQFEFPYGKETMVVRSEKDKGMLWYELKKDKDRRDVERKTQPQPQPQAVPQPQPQTLPAPSPSPGPAPTPPPAGSHDDGGGFWGGVGGGLLIIGGALLIAGTVVEDVATGGVGLLDDPVTIGGGVTGIGEGLALVRSAFALAA